ncbi:uncharacterized protein HaLaN_05549, partial [Haematococcus lacustris]
TCTEGRPSLLRRFDYVWPITLLRWYGNIFFQVLDIASMSLFLIALDCQYFPNPNQYGAEPSVQESDGHRPLQGRGAVLPPACAHDLLQRLHHQRQVILYSSFLIDVQSSYQSGYTQLQGAKRLDPSFLERFAIFSREQQHTQQSSGAEGGAGASRAINLVSYVEYQKNLRLVIKSHREALLALRHEAEKLEQAEEDAKNGNMFSELGLDPGTLEVEDLPEVSPCDHPCV